LKNRTSSSLSKSRKYHKSASESKNKKAMAYWKNVRGLIACSLLKEKNNGR
jgi:hypothetical protein